MHRVILMVLLVMSAVLFAQMQMKPCVTDNGGGITQNSSYKLLSSIGQSVAGVRTDGTNIEAGYITTELDLTAIREQHKKPPASPVIGEFVPNPFNSSTAISVYVPERCVISLNLFDVSGRLVYHWSDMKEPGTYIIRFTAGAELPAGSYMYELNVLGHRKTGKIAFVK